MAQLTVPVVFDHDDLQRLVNEKIAEVKAQFIPKADYENRLKADMVAMLTELQLEIDEIDNAQDSSSALDDCKDIIQQKINVLKGVEDRNAE